MWAQRAAAVGGLAASVRTVWLLPTEASAALVDGGGDLLDLVRRTAQALGDAPFLAIAGTLTDGGHDGAGLSGRGFAQAVLATAHGLNSLGFGRGDRLVIHLHRCVDEAVALCAAAVAGGIAVPIHPKLKDAQVGHVLADCEPWAVITSAVKGALLRDPARVLAGHRVFAVGPAPAGIAAEPFAALAQTAGDQPMSLPMTQPESQPPGQPAILLYTSGSTGLAKGVVQTHGNLVRGARIVADYLRLAPNDHILGVLPFSFDYGLNQLLSAMQVGCRITAADFLGLGELAALLRRVRPTGLGGVPALWHDLARGLATGAVTPADGDSLRYATNSGGRLGWSDIQTLRAQWPHVQVFSMYGLTEAFRSAFLPPELLDAHPDSFGRALPGVELLLVDPDTGAVLDGPAMGELVHAGALVAQGYWRRPEATAQRFRPDPRGGGGVAVFSGDLVRRDAAGLHYFVGRRDRMLKVSGHRISPDEVVQAVQGQPGIGAVAVYGVPGGEQGHRIVLCVQGDPADRELPQQLLRQCRARLPAYMVPAVVRVLAALPHNQNGKIDVARLQAEDEQGGDRPCIDRT